jgi:hypothetical protein
MTLQHSPTPFRPTDARASIEVDRGAKQVKVLGLLSAEEALAAFTLAGFEATPIGKRPHVSGSSNCCGHCA